MSKPYRQGEVLQISRTEKVPEVIVLPNISQADRNKIKNAVVYRTWRIKEDSDFQVSEYPKVLGEGVAHYLRELDTKPDYLILANFDKFTDEQIKSLSKSEVPVWVMNYVPGIRQENITFYAEMPKDKPKQTLEARI